MSPESSTVTSYTPDDLAALAERFWPRVRQLDHAACWLWTGGLGPRGYGHIAFQRRVWRVHRVAWLLSRGPIPHGLQVHHRCDVRLCCNPQHLWLGTQAENVTDMCIKERHRPRGRVPSHVTVSCETLQSVTQQNDLTDWRPPEPTSGWADWRPPEPTSGWKP